MIMKLNLISIKLLLTGNTISLLIRNW